MRHFCISALLPPVIASLSRIKKGKYEIITHFFFPVAAINECKNDGLGRATLKRALASKGNSTVSEEATFLLFCGGN